MSEKREQNTSKTNNNKVIKKLVVLVFAMFGFGFALVPLYDVFCDITGLNGKTNDVSVTYENDGIDISRTVTVQFITRMAKAIPWEFEPVMNEMTVHPGEVKYVQFYAKNKSQKDIVGQAVPSVSPGIAAGYFQKIECFCFNQQTIPPYEKIKLPLQVTLSAKAPEEVNHLSLSYRIYQSESLGGTF